MEIDILLFIINDLVYYAALFLASPLDTGGNILINIALINGETINKFSGIANTKFLTTPIA